MTSEINENVFKIKHENVLKCIKHGTTAIGSVHTARVVNRGVQNDTRVRGPFSQAPVHVTIPVNTARPVNRAREHGYLGIEHRVHGPCWQKALHDNNAFCQNDTHVPSLTGAVVQFLPNIAILPAFMSTLWCSAVT